MNNLPSLTISEEPLDADETLQQSSLDIAVVGVDYQQQLFIEEAISYEHNLEFLSFLSLKTAIRSGTFKLQGLLFFLVPAERQLAVHQIEIIKWVMSQQPGLNAIPLIPSKAIWDTMRKSLADHFPVYLPISCTNTGEETFSSRLHECIPDHFPQVVEALAVPAWGSRLTARQLRESNDQMQIKVAELLKANQQLEKELASAQVPMALSVKKKSVGVALKRRTAMPLKCVDVRFPPG